ncbi:zinc-dependent metalloprotease [Sphaerotilus uruguayifluvii]|uniref:DUF5117 domain-containing protein n=1 Tax=Sphaerotilus uruguayifluvii TaxID=2735897 RepID=A0ABX2G5I1_9BURK|nr:zinc-dependent metalloprotease [Leptothrix sp. C29]NRT57557.1 hypothetical protein [Leptothrix sp. C29]
MRRSLPFPSSLSVTALAAAVLLAGCATTADTAAPATAAPAAQAAASAAPAPARPAASAASAPAGAASAPSGAAAPALPVAALPPFAQVVREARRTDGLIPVWQKDEKVWLELSEKDFGTPFFLSPKIASGIGEGGVLGGLMGGRTGAGGAKWVEFVRVFNQVRLIARNAEYVAQAGTPQARAVAAAFSPSLLASTAVASQPHPERRTVLVDASALFQGDLMALGPHLQRTYRQGYSLDPRHSGITAVRGTPELLALTVQQHFATGALASAQPGMPPGASPSVPATLPDARSLFVQLHYSLTRLPAEPMRARAADARIGHFVTTVSDFGDEFARSPKKRFVNRWRLEKKDPAAALSEPVRPIVYWIDRSVPERYREPIRAGILEWNRAFEALGFKDAIVAKVQPEDADFDTLETGIASVRWMTNATAMFGAVGPSHVDPRSGEILDADIAIESLSSRALRTLRSQVIAAPAPAFAQPPDLGAPGSPVLCQHADLAAEQLGYALDVLSVREGLDPAGPEAEAFVAAYLKDVTMHEVGHTLGLRHNFRASTVRDEAQLSDPEFTRSHALTGSVMEYAAINLPARGQPRVAAFQTTLGPYDHWAIEYAYRELAPAEEAAALSRIAARSGEPELAFGTDEDFLAGLDPETLQGDLGRDPVVFARKRLGIARDLLTRLEAQPLAADADPAGLRRAVGFALRDVGRASATLLRQIGGLRTLRDAPGTGRDPLQPVPLAEQRRALELLLGELLSPQALTVSPALQRRLAPDYFERGEALLSGSGAVATDFSPPQQLAELQRVLLMQLASDTMATRLLDGADKSDATTPSLSLDELHQRLSAAVWAELDGHEARIDPARRALQREHVNQLAQWLLAPGAAGRAEMRMRVGLQARALLARLDKVRYRFDASSDTAAHLRDSADRLREALQARVVRPGV